MPEPRPGSVDLPPSGAAVVKAWAPWCTSCRALTPVVDRVADSTGVPVVSLRVDAAPDLVERLGVRSVPTLIALHDGAEVGRLVGAQSADAVESLFAVAGGAGGALDRHTPPSLATARAAAGAVVGVAGLVLGSWLLGAIGVAGVVWASFGLADRRRVTTPASASATSTT